MPEEPINAESPLEEQLVAYLDGELDAQSSRRIEELLAADPEVRKKLHRLERTWEMLDELDSTPVGEQFTRTTLEMVAVAAQEDVRKTLDEAPRRRRRLWLWAIGGMLAAGMAGFLTIALSTTDPNRQLLNELPVLENLDEYRQIGDLKFLNLLQKENLFVKGEENEPALSSPPSNKAGLLEQIKSLSPSQKADLLRKQERFADFDPAVREHLNQLCKEIQQAPAADDLMGIMRRYYEWWKSLPAYSRAELSALSSDDRIKWIKNRLQEEQAKISVNPPNAKDTEQLWRWMESYTATRERQFAETLTPQQREWLNSLKPIARPRVLLMMMLWQGPKGKAGKMFQISENDLADLISKFTPDTRKHLEEMTVADQTHTIQNWIHTLIRQRNLHSGQALAAMVDDDRLAEFFEKDLTGDQRDHLMSLPGEEMQRELLRLYITQTNPPEMFPHRQGGPAPGHRGNDQELDRHQGDNSK
jgi:hypothetical protein